MAIVKPCPFCGKSVSTIDNTNGDFAVVCDWGKDGCGAVGGYRGSQRAAIEAWNRRAKEKEPAERQLRQTQGKTNL